MEVEAGPPEVQETSADSAPPESMSSEDLMGLLDLAPDNGGSSTGELAFPEGSVEGPGKRFPPKSPTALELDKWDEAQGERMLEESPEIKKTGLSKEAVSDFLASAFKIDPALVERCEDERRHDFVKMLLETPEYKSLHETTALNLMASELASVQFTKEYYELVKKQEEREKEQKTKGKKPNPEKQKHDWDMSCLRAAGKSVKQAQQDVDDFNDAMDACGLGGDGGKPSSYDTKRMKELFQKVRGNQQLRRICELAGKFRRFAQGRQSQKTHHGYGDMVGVKLDDQLDRLLEEEVVTLLDPDYELDAMRRFVEKDMLAGEYIFKEKVGRGPIVVVVDESGSMSGEKICQAKAISLALTWIAKYQKRWIGLVAFSGGTEGRTLCLPPNKWNEVALLDWLVGFLGGGTDQDVPLIHLPNNYWPDFQKQGMEAKGRSDIIIISDAIMNVYPEVQNNFNNWKKKAEAKVMGVMVGVTDAGGLKGVLDEVYYASSLSTEHEGVQAALSI